MTREEFDLAARGWTRHHNYLPNCCPQKPGVVITLWEDPLDLGSRLFLQDALKVQGSRDRVVLEVMES